MNQPTRRSCRARPAPRIAISTIERFDHAYDELQTKGCHADSDETTSLIYELAPKCLASRVYLSDRARKLDDLPIELEDSPDLGITMTETKKLSYQQQLDADVAMLTDKLGLPRDVAYSRALSGKVTLTDSEKREIEVRAVMLRDNVTRDEAFTQIMRKR